MDNNNNSSSKVTNIFHYTDLNAVQSILENKNIRLTHSDYLNDREELFCGWKTLYEEAEKLKAPQYRYPYLNLTYAMLYQYLPDGSSVRTKEELEKEARTISAIDWSEIEKANHDLRYNRITCEEFDSKIKQIEHMIKSNYPEAKNKSELEKLKVYIPSRKEKQDIRSGIFIASFSQEDDCLSQWRSYGMFAIEFDQDSLKVDDRLRFNTCKYQHDDTDKQKAARLVEDIYNYSKDLLTTVKVANNRRLTEEIINYMSIYKNSGFAEEKEVRAVSGAVKGKIKGDYDFKEIKFRSKGEYLVPYIEQGFNVKAIKAIHIGPVKDPILAYRSLVNFINYLRLTKDLDYSGIEIKFSNIPYRS